jgi:3-isopropylmalate/(R)-2-methylmalate dehydratase small subunit
VKISSITTTGVPLLLDDIDTDRIIPARFLRCVTFDGLGEHAFADDRQQDQNHPFDAVEYQDSGLLVAGRNFGCGSSREHAPQSLMRWGIKAIVAESYAEIFFGNCTSLGMPAVTASRSDLETLNAAVLADATTQFTLDLINRQISFGDKTIAVSIPDNAHDALTSGRWDFLSQLLEAGEQIDRTAKSLPYISEFSAGA